MRAKICGIDSPEAARVALEAGADALGFLVGITHLAEDKITNQDAAAIIRTLPPFVSAVAVTHLQTAADIIPMARFIGADTIQLHNDIALEDIATIRREMPGIKLIKGVSVTGPEAVDRAKSFVGHVDAILLDSRTQDRLGGTGLTHDWSISRRIVEECPLPVILAGGLNPDNLARAIKKVRPYAVDVNSGVETDRRKDPEKTEAFVRIAHRARTAQ